jgi:predicted negative regulator of RcsB-dependent stress response
MPENLFETQYDLTKKSKLREFYESNKILIYSAILTLIIIIVSYTYYQAAKEKKKIFLSENYIKAKVYLESGNKTEAIKILRNVIFSNDPTYSTLSFFIILNENLINDNSEVSELFDHLLENNKFDQEIRNLLLYKKALYKSNYVEELKLLEETKSLLHSKESVWNAHVLLLLGDFYFSKKEFIKAKDFYLKVLSKKDLLPNLYNQARSKLAFISDD